MLCRVHNEAVLLYSDADQVSTTLAPTFVPHRVRMVRDSVLVVESLSLMLRETDSSVG